MVISGVRDELLEWQNDQDKKLQTICRVAALNNSVQSDLCQTEAVFGDFERHNCVAGRASPMLGDMQRPSHFSTLGNFSHVDDRVSVGQNVPLVQWPANQLIEHDFS